jgi:hypothetical protein
VSDRSMLRPALVAACGMAVLVSAVVPPLAAARAQGGSLRTLQLERVIGGASGGDEYLFGRIVGVAAAPDGRVYILDGQSCVARAFTAAGKFLRTLGGPGGGPGEFQCPGASLEVLGSELVSEHDRSGRRSRFTLDGVHIATTQGVRPARDSAHIARHEMRHGNEIVVVAARIGYVSGREQLRYTTVENRRRTIGRDTTLLRFRSGFAYVAPRSSSSYVTHAPSGFGAAGAWAMHGDSLVALADGKTGYVTWMVATATGMRTVRRDSVQGVRRTVSSVDLNALATQWQRVELTGRFSRGVDIVDAPSHWSVAHRAFFAADGYLWVAGVAQRGLITWTAFPPSGRAFAIAVPSDFWLTVVSNGRLYGYVNDGNDGPVVRVYRIQ